MDPGSSTTTLTDTRRARLSHVSPTSSSATWSRRGAGDRPPPLSPDRPSPSSSDRARRGSVFSLPSAHSRRTMLPSHHPNHYASEASASDDDETDRDGQESQDRHANSGGERRKREEARQRRRAKHASAGSSIFNANGPATSPPESSAKRRTGRDYHGSSSTDFGDRQQTETQAHLDGLGLRIGHPETDYQVLVDEAALQSLPFRNQAVTTHSSTLGYNLPLPDQTSSNTRRSRQHSEAVYMTEDRREMPKIVVNEVDSAENETGTNHVRFGAVSHESTRERRTRPRPMHTTTPIETDHIVFPDTLPPAFYRGPLPKVETAQACHPPLAVALPYTSQPSAAEPSPPGLSSPVKNANRSPSVRSSHHGIGSYAKSASSIASQSSLQLVLDDPIPDSPRFRTPSGRSTRSRGRSDSSFSLEDSPILADHEFTVNSRSARQAKRPNGPTTIVGEILAHQDPGRLYFPSGPMQARPESTASSERSPPLSIISSVFPSRPRPSPTLNGSSESPLSPTSCRFPFPPPPASSKSSTSLVFPSPPAPSSPPRFGRSRYAPRPSPSLSQNVFPDSPSLASTLSSLSAQSTQEPVFPLLGARLNSDGLVRSGVTPRRVSGSPWEKNAGVLANTGDELDRMMAAQRTAISDEESIDVHEAKFREREKERKRKNIYNELLRSKTSDSLADNGELDSFQRELLARDTIKKSLGAPLMSEDLKNKTPSETSDQEDGESTGMTPSTSASSDMSTLPPFPDVPTHTYRLPTSVSCQSADTIEDPNQVEIVLSDNSSVIQSPITPTFAYSYHPTDPPKANQRKQMNRMSLASSTTSEQSHYEDAVEEPSPALPDEGCPEPEPPFNPPKQQTSLWVQDILDSTNCESLGRPLSDIGEIEEPEEVLGDNASPMAAVAESADATERIVPKSPSDFSFHSQSPSMPAVAQRCDSPTLSQRSRSTSSSAPTSYTASKRLPVASAAPLKSSKSIFGKKISSLFGGGPSYNAAALGLRGSGISSRDVASLDRPSTQNFPRSGASVASKPSPKLNHRRAPSSSHSRSNSHSSSSYSTFAPIPTTPSSFANATFAGPPENRAPPPDQSNEGAHKLADLLSKFEQEDKARFRGIAESRLGKSPSSAVVA